MEELEKWVWKKWKQKWKLVRIARELSEKTKWSIYYSLCFVVDFLHNEKGIGFSRKQLRYAFNKLLNDKISNHPEQWRFLLSLGGYTYKKKSS